MNGSCIRPRNHILHHARVAIVGWLAWTAVGALHDPRVNAEGPLRGSVAARGNYYFERSTRVVAPSVSASLITPSGARIEGTYLVDAITSASQATGVQSDVGFTEVRNDVQGGVGYEFDFGGVQLDLSTTGRFSKEPDYRSLSLSQGAALALFDRSTTLRANASLLRDAVFKVDRSAPPTDPDKLTATKPVRVGTFEALSMGVALDQVLTPTLVATLGADLAFLDGFQANVYRTAAFADGGGRPEEHPRSRTRQAYYAWLAQYLTSTTSAIRVGYRFYTDSWDVTAHAPEVRFHQEFGRFAEIRLRYRYYTQTSARFWRQGGNLRADRYVTADPKMSAFRDQTFGVKMRMALGFLSFTPLDFAREAVLDFGAEYIFNTNRFGNGVIAQGGLLWPF